MQIIYQLNETQIKQLHVLYQNTWWAKERSLDNTRKCVKNSSIIIAITDQDNNLQAFCRILTDYIFKASIFDVIVAEEFQGQGFARKLLELIKTHKDLAEVKHFELYCLPDKIAFYEKYGFTTNVDGMKIMRNIAA